MTVLPWTLATLMVFYGTGYKNVFPSFIASFLICHLIIISLFYVYTFCIDEKLWIDIIIFIIGVVLSLIYGFMMLDVPL